MKYVNRDLLVGALDSLRAGTFEQRETMADSLLVLLPNADAEQAVIEAAENFVDWMDSDVGRQDLEFALIEAVNTLRAAR